MKRKTLWLAVALGGLILFGAAADSRAAEPVEIGMVHFESAELGGAILASGDVVLDRGLVRTESTQAVVHLGNGQVLKLETNSAARFEALSFDEIKVTVYSGRVVKFGANGTALTAGSGSNFTLGPSSQDSISVEQALMDLPTLGQTSGKLRNRGLER
jgi:hypothetical protein